MKYLVMNIEPQNAERPVMGQAYTRPIRVEELFPSEAEERFWLPYTAALITPFGTAIALRQEGW